MIRLTLSLRISLLVATCLIAAPSSAQNVAAKSARPFTGTWKGDIASAKLPEKIDVFQLKDGRYTCPSCVPAVAVKADGTPQASAGHDYWDHLAVKAVDANTVAYTYYRAGKVMTSSTDPLSADGKTLTSNWRSNDNAKGLEQSGTSTETRVAPAAPGAHAASGSWKQAEIKQISDSNLILILDDTGTALKMSQPSGEHYTASFGGPAVPFVGDPGKTMIKVRRVGPRTIEETDTRGGKIVAVYTMTLGPDDKTLAVKVDNRQQGTTTQFVAYRQ